MITPAGRRLLLQRLQVLRRNISQKHSFATSYGRLSTGSGGLSTGCGLLYIRTRRSLHNLKYCIAFIHADGLQGYRVALQPCLITLFTNTTCYPTSHA